MVTNMIIIVKYTGSSKNKWKFPFMGHDFDCAVFSCLLTLSPTSRHFFQSHSETSPRPQVTATVQPPVRLEAKAAIAGSCRRGSNAVPRSAGGGGMCFISFLVGGFNPFRKYLSIGIISSNRGENM